MRESLYRLTKPVRPAFMRVRNFMNRPAIAEVESLRRDVQSIRNRLDSLERTIEDVLVSITFRRDSD